MKIGRLFLCVLFALIAGCSVQVLAQDEDKEPAYETLYDEPYAINKLFVGFQPLYGELFATNVNAGFGFDAQYYHKTRFDVKFQARKTYSSKFYDFNRELALKNSSVSNTPEVFNYYEIGGTYHINDFDVYSNSKFLLMELPNKNNGKSSKSFPGVMEVPGKLRKIIGARAGAIIWNSTIDVNRTLEEQGLTNADLRNTNNESLPDTFTDDNGDVQQMNAFSNLYAANIYLGGSFTMIRNIAVDFEGYSEGIDDGIFTVFFDIMFAPSLKLDPILFNGMEYSTSPIKTKTFGARVGAEGKFNRKLGWGYGGELGYRPSIDGRGFFALFKISFPIFSTNLQKKETDTE